MKEKIQSQREQVKEWVNDYGDDLFRWAYYKTGDRETAEDIVQDTFLAAIRSVENFKGKSQPKTWLYSILKNKITDHFRSGYRQTHVNGLNQEKAVEINDGAADVFFDSEGSWKSDFTPDNWHEMNDELLDDHEFRSVFDLCMKGLPRKWFDALNFKYLDGKDGNAVSQELGISQTNYWQILHRAKVQVRVCIEKYWFKH